MSMPDLLFSAVEPLLGNVRDTVVAELAALWGVDENRHKLELQLDSIIHVLSDAKGRWGTNPEIRAWVKDVKAATYRADDVLDTFRYLTLRQQARIGESVITKACKFLVQHRSLYQIAMSSELTSVTQQLDGHIQEMQRLNLLDDTVVTEGMDLMTLSTPCPSAGFVGRETDKKKIVDRLLLEPNNLGLLVLPIVGLGGVGKSALANEVLNDRRVNEHFSIRKLLFVPDNVDSCGLLNLILELVTNGEDVSSSGSIEVLKSKLIIHISQKRILLVMDDVSETHWWQEQVRPVLSWAAGPGSCILLTTRSKRVASRMGTLPAYHLEVLDDSAAWEVFSQDAFCKEVPERLKKEMIPFGKCIVDKCKGLPLAVKVVATHMSDKQLVSEWKNIAQSNILELADTGNKIMPMLQLSWNQLTREAKTCFAFLAYFEKGAKMYKDSLIQIWAALGYLNEEVGISAEKKGEMVFSELVAKCFLDVENVTCTMHDLVYDFARSLFKDECLSGEQLVRLQHGVPNSAIYVRVSECDDLSQFEEIGKRLHGMEQMRMLFTPATRALFNVIGKGPKQFGLKSLRVLQCVGTPNLYRQLEFLIHLRYLDLSLSPLKKLPESLCLLYHLQTLKLNKCRFLESLPEGTAAMRQLRHVYLMDCPRLRRMPRNLGMLLNLHTLTTFVVDDEEGRGISELGQLQLLRNRLEIRGLRKVNRISRAQDANLYEKDEITHLVLSWEGFDNEEVVQANERIGQEEVLEALKPHSRLLSLELQSYGGRKVSSWMKDVHNFERMKELTIEDCPNCIDLPLVWLSGNLEYLKLSKLPNVKVMCLNVSQGADISLFLFPALKTMMLSGLPQLTRWADSRSLPTFPKLEALHIISCQEIASVPKCPVLKMIEIHVCKRLSLQAFADVRTLWDIAYSFDPEEIQSGGLHSFPLDSWPALYSLCLNSILPLRGTEPPLAQTCPETLRVLRLSKGKGCFSSSLEHIHSWDYFAHIEVLDIISQDLVTWPMEVEGLQSLKVLTIRECRKLVKAGSSAMFPPKLEKLCVQSCICLMELPDLTESLQEVVIMRCPKLRVCPSWTRHKPCQSKLRMLSVSFCYNLEELPNGELANLERLSICNCPQIKSLSIGVLARMSDSKLEYLEIRGCPHLQAYCTNGGVYSKLVSRVPYREVEAIKRQKTIKGSGLLCPCTSI